MAALNPSATIYSCDYAATAVQLLRDNAAFDAARMHAFVADITHDDLTLHVPPASIDVVTCIFVFSANAPDHLPQVSDFGTRSAAAMTCRHQRHQHFIYMWSLTLLNYH